MLQQNGATPLPEFFVGKTITNNRVTRYMDTKYELLSDSLGKPDTKAIWYSRDHVAQWLSEIDKAGADGMRVYFGAYGENENYSGQLCLLMVMTKANSQTSGHDDFTVEDEADFTDRALPDGFGRDRDFNTGSPCPPVCEPNGLNFPGE